MSSLILLGKFMLGGEGKQIHVGPIASMKYCSRLFSWVERESNPKRPDGMMKLSGKNTGVLGSKPQKSWSISVKLKFEGSSRGAEGKNTDEY